VKEATAKAMFLKELLDYDMINSRTTAGACFPGIPWTFPHFHPNHS
jgi:hypothetical protein